MSKVNLASAILGQKEEKYFLNSHIWWYSTLITSKLAIPHVLLRQLLQVVSELLTTKPLACVCASFNTP